MTKNNLRPPTGYHGDKATNKKLGIMRFATAAEATAGVANDVALTPSQGAALVPPASTTVAGIVRLATLAETVTGTSAVIATTPAGITARLAAPGPIGGTTPAAGTFTTVVATTTISAGTTITAGTGIVATTGNIVASAGAVSASSTVTAGTSMTAGTTITATAGAITATNGNLVFGTAGNKILGLAAANTATAGAHSRGTTTLISGTITISTTAVTSNSLIKIWRQDIGASTAMGFLTVGTIVAGVSFDVFAATQAAPGTPLATDLSVVGWEITN